MPSLKKFKRNEAAKLLSRDDVFATVLVSIGIDLYGDEFFTMESADLYASMEEDLGGRLCEENENKIQAAITAMTTDLFTSNAEVFRSITLALASGDIGEFDDDDDDDKDDDDLDACKLLWALTEVGILTDTPYKKMEAEMSDRIVALFNKVVDAEAEDKSEVPDEVDTIDEALSIPYYRRYVIANVLEMAKQFLHIGADPTTISELLEAHHQSLEAVETDIV